MVYTISGLTLHRLKRMVAVSDASIEARTVVDAMVHAVHKLDPAFFDHVGEVPPRGG